MKKRILTCALAAAAFLTVQAQRSESMVAFKHLGIGVEVGTSGAGVELSMPVVKDHLVVMAGYNFGTFGQDIYSRDIIIDKSTANDGIDQLNREVAKHNAKENVTHIDEAAHFTNDVAIKAGVKLGGYGKVLLEYYPSARSTFHLVGGLMFGNEKMITVSGVADDEVQNLYNQAMDVQRQLQQNGDIDRNDDFITEKLSYNIRRHTYAIKETQGAKDNVKAELSFVAPAVRPYLGLGWGRSVPKKRVGFQFEMGCWYHGKLKIESPNEVTFNKDVKNDEDVDNIVKNVKQLLVYPQITLRLTGRLF